MLIWNDFYNATIHAYEMDKGVFQHVFMQDIG
jgi:hypothetical protein